jgi:hypothetical protein
MKRLNVYITRICVVESDRCACEQASETVEHFLFNLLRETHREHLPKQTGGSLSNYLREEETYDKRNWKFVIEAVRTTIIYNMQQANSTEAEPSNADITFMTCIKTFPPYSTI